MHAFQDMLFIACWGESSPFRWNLRVLCVKNQLPPTVLPSKPLLFIYFSSIQNLALTWSLPNYTKLKKMNLNVVGGLSSRPEQRLLAQWFPSIPRLCVISLSQKLPVDDVLKAQFVCCVQLHWVKNHGEGCTLHSCPRRRFLSG